MKVAALLVLAPLASAFVIPPSAPKTSSRSRTIRMAFEAEPGAIAPTGYWDPLGFSTDGDVAKFDRYRQIEIKHGRIAQLAFLHYLVTYFYKLPGNLGDVPIDSIPTGLGSIQAVPTGGWAQILLFAAALEVLAPQKEGRVPGDVQPDTPAFPKTEDKTPEQFAEYQNKEINNGRLAQVAIAGIWAQELVSGGQHPFDTLLAKLGA